MQVSSLFIRHLVCLCSVQQPIDRIIRAEAYTVGYIKQATAAHICGAIKTAMEKIYHKK